jgi:hypothetical protein
VSCLFNGSITYRVNTAQRGLWVDGHIIKRDLKQVKTFVETRLTMTVADAMTP